ncbi:hypothetical protein AU192_10750 [Mycobacterium lehmannii]|uniref:DUF3533 domain-containing protein n=1 Tax=Mycobacterium lehmannii TaxID=2048550 RepID=A0A117JM51_9MYCO|nr:hypothetical protein [Mycobacterium lehmannii]KUI20943.1 hypothetical protein AU192_10750 [Mycobacterium lehmannii]
MGKHHAPEHSPLRDPTAVRTTVLALLGMALVVIAMIASYSGAFAKPTLHDMTVAVAGTQRFVDGVRGNDALTVIEVGDEAVARQQVYERNADAAFAVHPGGAMTIYVAGGGGRSVAAAAESVGEVVASRAGLHPVVEDVAPPSAGDPSGTVEFYAVIFLSIGASVAATVLGRFMGTVRRPATLALRTATLVAYSALLAGGVTLYVDVVLDALVGHIWQVFGTLWLYAMAVGGAITGVAAAFGAAASLALTGFLVIIGNAAAAGPVGRPLLSEFYATFSAIVPQGAGVSLLRSVVYFGGNGAQPAVLTLLAWGAAGCLLASLATAARVNYRAVHEHLARRRDLLRPRVLSPAD